MSSRPPASDAEKLTAYYQSVIDASGDSGGDDAEGSGSPAVRFGDLDPLESDGDDADFESDYKAPPQPKRRSTKRTADTLSTSDMFKPKVSKGDKAPSESQSAKLASRGKLPVKAEMLQRPTEYGPVTIKQESIDHVSG